jgi:hypothetical protein
MRKPETPPPLDELVQSMSVDGFLAKIAGHHLFVSSHGRYDHWDEIRYRSPPGDLTREEWWTAMKLSRRAAARPIPLLDIQGRNFTYALPDEVLRENEFVSINTGGCISLSEEVTNSATRDRYMGVPTCSPSPTRATSPTSCCSISRCCTRR